MKPKLKITLLILILFSVSQLKAKVKTGPEAGINFSRMTLQSSGVAIVPSALTTFHIGWDVEFNLKHHLGLQTGLIFSSKGAKYNVNGYEFQITPSYLVVPINLMIKNIISPMVFLSAGPYFAYGFSGKIKSGAFISDMNFGDSNDSYIKHFDYGLDLGIGFGTSSFQLSGKYELGIANLSPQKPSSNKIRNGVFEVSLAIFLGKNY